MITLDQWYAQRKGQALLVPGQPEAYRGQCVQAADYALNEIYGRPYHYGNAIDWWNNPQELLDHFDKISDGLIKKGDFVIYNSTLPGSGSFGHIDVAAQDGAKGSYLGYDSNWGGNKTLHQVTHAGSENKYILGSLRLKGGTMPGVMTKDAAYKVVTYLYQLGTGGPPTPDQGEYWAQRMTEILTAIDELGQAMQKELEARMNATYLPYAGDQLFIKKK